jgi:hypothetical protein
MDELFCQAYFILFNFHLCHQVVSVRSISLGAAQAYGQDFAMNFLNKKEAYYYPAGAQQTAMENQMTVTIYFS